MHGINKVHVVIYRPMSFLIYLPSLRTLYILCKIINYWFTLNDRSVSEYHGLIHCYESHFACIIHPPCGSNLKNILQEVFLSPHQTQTTEAKTYIIEYTKLTTRTWTVSDILYIRQLNAITDVSYHWSVTNMLTILFEVINHRRNLYVLRNNGAPQEDKSSH